MKIKQIYEELINYFKEDIWKFPDNINFLFLILIGFWFIKEITGIWVTGKLNFIYNLLVIFLALLVLKFNRRKKNKKSIKSLIFSGINLKKDFLVIISILAFLIPMLSIINWDLPYHFHPGDDEYVVPSMYFSNFEFGKAINNPNHSQNPLYDNQHLMYYVLTPLFFIFKPLGNLVYGSSPIETAPYFFLARLFNYFFSISIIFLTYLTGKKLFNRKVGFLASLLLAVSKLFMHYSLFMRSDILLTLFSALFVYVLSVDKFQENKIRYGFLGALVGLGTSLKPYMLLWFIPVLFTWIFKKREQLKDKLCQISSFFANVLVFFTFGRFYHNFVHKDFGGGFSGSLEKSTTAGHYGSFPGLDFLSDKFLFSIRLYSWWLGKSFILIFLLSILGFLLYFLVKKKKMEKYFFLFSCIIPAFLFFGSQLVQTGKFNLIILNCIFLYISASLIQVNESKFTVGKILLNGIFIFFILETTFLSLGKIYLLNKKDVRIRAKEWICENIKNDTNLKIMSNVINWQQPPKISDCVQSNNQEDYGYILICTSGYNKAYYWLSIGEVLEFEEREKEHRIERLDFDLVNKIFTNRRVIFTEGDSYELVKVFEKEQSFLGLPYNEYFDHPASWELWGINNPMPILLYRKNSL